MAERRMIFGFAAVVIVSFGAILYGFSVYVTDAAAGADFSTTTLSLGLTGATIANGLLAPGLGRFMDEHGVRGVTAVGGLMAWAGMVAFSYSTTPWHVIAAWWLVIGPATAMVYYEPSLVGITAWVPPARRPGAFGMLTVLGGLAGAIYLPLTERMVTVFGWRPTVRMLGLVIALVAVGVAWLIIPAGPGHPQHRRPKGRRITLRSLLSDRRFMFVTLALILTFGPIQGMVAHRVDRFFEAGFSLAVVSLWAGAASLISMPGRYAAPLAAARWNPVKVTSATIGVLAVSLMIAVPGTSSWSMVGHFTVFGVAFGALTPLRAMVMTRWYAGEHYGAISGAQWSAIIIVAAVWVWAVGAARDLLGDYRIPVAAMAAMVALAAILILRAEVSERAGTG